MPNLDDVLVAHIKTCTLGICDDEQRHCDECIHYECIRDCPGCAQEKLLTWQRENCKLEPVWNPCIPYRENYQTYGIARNRQLAQDQQTINKILGVE